MKKDFSPKSRKDNLVIQELDGEVLIYDLQTDKAMCLNPTSALVWQACDGNRSVSDINDFIGKKLKTEVNEDLVWLALDQLKKEKLIENGAELNSRFEGMSRREVIKKVGLATAITLPVIASLAAPLNVYALSCGRPCRCPNGTPNGMTCPGSPNTAGFWICTDAAPTCTCNGNFGANDSGGAGFKTGTCG